MSCIDRHVRCGVLGLGVLAGCSGSPPPAQSSAPAAPAPAAARAPASASAAVPASAPVVVAHPHLPPPAPVRSWAEVRLQAAQRMLAANPERSYSGAVPEPLLAIPVLEIELNGDGSVRRIEVLRAPRQAKDTTQIAADAVRRAAPFGDVSRLPKPWRFTETFLFDDERRFKPRTLDR